MHIIGIVVYLMMNCMFYVHHIIERTFYVADNLAEKESNGDKKRRVRDHID